MFAPPNRWVQLGLPFYFSLHYLDVVMFKMNFPPFGGSEYLSMLDQPRLRYGEWLSDGGVFYGKGAWARRCSLPVSFFTYGRMSQCVNDVVSECGVVYIVVTMLGITTMFVFLIFNLQMTHWYLVKKVGQMCATYGRYWFFLNKCLT